MPFLRHLLAGARTTAADIEQWLRAFSLEGVSEGNVQSAQACAGRRRQEVGVQYD